MVTTMRWPEIKTSRNTTKFCTDGQWALNHSGLFGGVAFALEFPCAE